jgi:hypothetical protein
MDSAPGSCTLCMLHIFSVHGWLLIQWVTAFDVQCACCTLHIFWSRNKAARIETQLSTDGTVARVANRKQHHDPRAQYSVALRRRRGIRHGH